MRNPLKKLGILERRGPSKPTGTPLEKAVAWVRANRAPGGGIRVNHLSDLASREVTGYLIDSLFRCGQKELAFELARWEAAGQAPDGSVVAPDGVPYTFDTAQVIRGFLAVVDELPEIEPHLRRACDWVAAQVERNGRVTSPSYDMWDLPDGTRFTEYANLYVLPPLVAAGEKFGESAWSDAGRRGMDYFRAKPDLVRFKPELATLSHIFGYMMEALAELGEVELARKGLAQAAEIQRADGAIPAYPGVEWVCSTGLAQLALAWYRIGEPEPATRALAYLERLQNPSGGFYGSYGEGAVYLPKEEISWAVKFFIDALLLQKQTGLLQKQTGAAGDNPRHAAEISR